MKQKNAKSAKTNPPTAQVGVVDPQPSVAVITPESAKLAGVSLLEKNPALRDALVEFSSAFGAVVEKLRAVCIQLRAAKLNPKEQSLALGAAGVREDTASKIKRVCNDTDENFDRYIKGDLGFNAALEVARGELPPGAEPAKLAKDWRNSFETFVEDTARSCPGKLPKKKAWFKTELEGAHFVLTIIPARQKKARALPVGVTNVTEAAAAATAKLPAM